MNIYTVYHFLVTLIQVGVLFEDDYFVKSKEDNLSARKPSSSQPEPKEEDKEASVAMSSELYNSDKEVSIIVDDKDYLKLKGENLILKLIDQVNGYAKSILDVLLNGNTY